METPAIWENKPEPRVRQSNRVWATIAFAGLVPLGTDGVRHDETGDATNPRQEVRQGDRLFKIQIKVKSRDQNHRMTAWYAASQVQLRLNQTYAKEKWLDPNDLKIATVGEVIPMPAVLHDNRFEDVAVLEVAFNTTIYDTDAASIGTWIEQAEVSSAVDGWDSSLELDDETMPPI